MGRRAQVLIIFIWILIVLVILVVSISRRSSITLKFIRFQKDRQVALYLAKGGINRVIVKLREDTNAYDTPKEKWAQAEQEIRESGELKFSAVDEESKININAASLEVLTALLEDFDITAAQEIAKNILIWRGAMADANNIYENLGYPAKAEKFTAIEELVLVKDITPQDCQKLKEFITVYTEGAININTVSDRVLKIIARALAPGQIGLADEIAEKLIATRDNSGGYFQEKDKIDIPGLAPNEVDIFNKLKDSLTIKSNNFFIEASARTGKIETKISAVYNRKEKLLYWHED